MGLLNSVAVPGRPQAVTDGCHRPSCQGRSHPLSSRQRLKLVVEKIYKSFRYS